MRCCGFSLFLKMGLSHVSDSPRKICPKTHAIDENKSERDRWKEGGDVHWTGTVPVPLNIFAQELHTISCGIGPGGTLEWANKCNAALARPGTRNCAESTPKSQTLCTVKWVPPFDNVRSRRARTLVNVIQGRKKPSIVSGTSQYAQKC